MDSKQSNLTDKSEKENLSQSQLISTLKPNEAKRAQTIQQLSTEIS
jgi:hypothetical protein